VTGSTGTTGAVPRMSPPATLRGPLSSVHASLGAVVATEGGAELVRSYTDADDEAGAVVGTVGVADVTIRGKIDVRGSLGPQVADLADTRRIADEWIILLLPPGPAVDRVASLRSAAGPSVMVTDVTHLYAGFALVGPAVDRLVARLTSWDPSTLAVGAATGAPIADVRSLVVRHDLRVPALEILVGMEFAGHVWRSVLEASKPLDGRPVGWDALRGVGWS
jgi:glycine cleavage system aminomethyltransferase T